MTAVRPVYREPLAEHETTGEPPDVDSVLVGFNWEFSDAERERFGEAIMCAIANDGEPASVKKGARARRR